MGQELLNFGRTEVPGMSPLTDVTLAPEQRYVGLGRIRSLSCARSSKPGRFAMLPISPAS